MKKILYLILISLVFTCENNTKVETKVVEIEVSPFKESNVFNDCEDARSNAFKDFGKGKFVCTSLDYMEFVSLDDNFEEFVQTILFSKYSIVVHDYPNLSSANDMCYTKTMDSLIFNKHEDNVYAKTREYARSIYHISKEEKVKLLDLNKAYSNTLDSYPKFMGNDQIISDYLRQTIDSEKELKAAIFTINTKGIIYDLSFNEDVDFDKSKMIKDLNSLGKFIPGYLLGIKVNSVTWYYFK